MASIQKRITKEGRTTYRALIRIKGCPTRSATFDRCSDARRWSQEQEVDLRSTRPTCNMKNEQHTLGELVDRYVSQVLPDKKDIGTNFPNTKKFKNIRSPKMLKPIIDNLYKSNFSINNLDINLICEQPKVSKYRDKIINSISKLTTLNKDLINLKGKTVEKLGLIGKEKAIACEVIVSITKYD